MFNSKKSDQGIPLVFSKIILGFISPFVYWMVIVIINFAVRSLRVLKVEWQFLASSFILLSIFLQPDVIS